MKTINKYLLLLSIAVIAISVFNSCKKDEVSGEPSVKYVRITRPESSDSLLVGAGQGRLIAIVGENLQDAVEVWFNDQQARLTPTYITNTTILVVVPNPIPKDITNKLKIVFKNGFVLLHDFVVQISEPYIGSMVSEFVNDGDIAIIRGDFFYEPLTVKFTGGVNGNIVSVKDQEIQVRVPVGVLPGQIIVKTNFGETKSNFWFRDNRNHFIDSDPYEGWWNSSYVVSNPGPTDPPKISGNYLRFKKQVGAWSWSELAGGPATAMPVHSKNIPDAAILKPEDYYLKFEVNTIKPYNGNVVKINVALSAEDNNGYKWNPPFDTKGQWQTITIPLNEVFAEYTPKPVVNPNGYWSRIVVGNAPGDWDADIAFDNLRIVPKVLK
ncbi:MAG TPA: glycan-binding surface protein [Chitinophagaceae bacterium]|nr:glycan-binding surface protein [Chitinophagaceae bacterium]